MMTIMNSQEEVTAEDIFHLISGRCGGEVCYRGLTNGPHGGHNGGVTNDDSEKMAVSLAAATAGDSGSSDARMPSPPVGAEKEKKKKRDKKSKSTARPRIAFQTRSQVDVLDDGYRWRKYGQKSVKNNKFPRSYYRCTHRDCNVKKQVQRLSKDEEIVVTTYEGMHTHPTEKNNDNFEQILSQLKIYTRF